MDRYISNKIKNMSFIMTIFVVILHSNNLQDPSVLNINTLVQNFIGQGIVRIAVPMFFVISGYLFYYKFKPSKEAYLSKYKKRFKSLFIPYFIWCTGWLVILYVIELTAFGRAMFSDRIVADYNAVELFQNTYIYPLPYQFWYIRALMINVIISPIIYFVIDKLKDKALIVILVFWFFDVIYYPILMFSVGACIAIKGYNLNFEEYKNKRYLFGIGYLLAIVIKTIFMYIPNIPYYEYVLLLVENVIILCGLPFAWFFYDVIRDEFRSKIDLGKELKLAKYGIFIYFFHIPLQSIIKKIWFMIIPQGTISSLVIFFVAPMVTITICAIVAILMRKYMKKLYQTLTGGR